jgi:hypothetical protein
MVYGDDLFYMQIPFFNQKLYELPQPGTTA